jgi:hypothetical protein
MSASPAIGDRAAWGDRVGRVTGFVDVEAAGQTVTLTTVRWSRTESSTLAGHHLVIEPMYRMVLRFFGVTVLSRRVDEMAVSRWSEPLAGLPGRGSWWDLSVTDDYGDELAGIFLFYL